MKFNLWRIVALGLVFALGFSIWYSHESAQTSKRNIAMLRDEKASLDKKMADLILEKEGLNDKILALDNEKAELALRVEGYDSQIRDITGRLETIKNALSLKEEELTKKSEEIAYLNNAVEQYKKDVARIRRKLFYTKKGPRENASSGSADITDKNAPTQLEPITVTSKAWNDKAEILEVNKKFGFIVIAAGSEVGLKSGDLLYAFHNREALGKILIEKVGSGVSVARVLEKSVLDNVQKGDLAGY